MDQGLSIFPAGFWVVIALLIFGGFWAGGQVRGGTGLPVLAVLATVAFWYVGDALYNDYANYHAKTFAPEILGSAWWQVAWFLVVFLSLTPMIHRRVNARLLGRSSGVIKIIKDGVGQPVFQHQLERLFQGCFFLWAVLTIIAVVRIKGEILYYFFPFGGHSAGPWGRGRVGTGFDFFIALAAYFDELVAAAFGVVAAASTHRRTRVLAMAFCLLCWPHYIVNRTRSALLAVVIPAIVTWVFLRLRGGMVKRFAVLAACFLVVNAWMKFIIANRSQTTITEALHEKKFTLSDKQNIHHEGLNMFEELCWISTFLEQGTYHINWGSRYFAEVANIVPRKFWAGKPEIGTDYAIARGQADGQGGLNATISTGLIGQGVVNFGPLLGPVAAALLMSIWVAVLARVDLTFDKVGRILLYPFGLILTFNLGRDITLLILYPFVFAEVLLWWIDRSR
ncbi:MAG TPA: hypothetical protein VK731_02480, partial [Candidatus Cybelea sp.]|nr:hypothetical protein [Candidatus Cybelea sp.]